MRSLEWTGDTLRILDQTQLPHQVIWNSCHCAKDVAEAIVSMQVRGAPAIAAAAAFGLVLEAAVASTEETNSEAFFKRLAQAIVRLERTRPTAVNLFFALDKMKQVLGSSAALEPDAAVQALRVMAESIAAQDIATNRAIGKNGADLLPKAARVLTHCNTGSLATVEYGTALGIIRELHHRHQLELVYVDETRPFLQGARLTTYELGMEGIPHTLITDSMAGHFMKLGCVDAVLVGADRIASNGDTANKIGTYTLAVLCRHHGIPFYVAAPTTTFDWSISSGEEIIIEERDEREVLEVLGHRMAPEFTNAAHPAFDVTPHALITAIVTEHGIINHPELEAMMSFQQGRQEVSR